MSRGERAERVVWHDVECGGYRADLPLWRALTAPGPVLDVGAGTGRVALDLARHGREVWALDADPELLGALRERAGDLPIHTVCQRAEELDLPVAFAAILVPMQTIQLLRDRGAFLRRARAHVTPGGLLAAALADEIAAFDGPLVAPDVAGRYVSQPTAVRILDDVVRLERTRDDGERVTHDVVDLARLDAAALEREARAAGWRPAGRRRISPTDEHVGSTVVVLGA